MSDDVDHFAVLGVTSTATEAEIKKAYRQRALQLHPDKNRDVDPKIVADRFNALVVSYEILTNPVARATAEKKARDEVARKERQGAWEGKRKAMVDELDRREEEDRKRRKQEATQKRDEEQVLNKLKEEGRKRREAKQAEADQEVSQQIRSDEQSRVAPARDQDDDSVPELGPLDLTARLRFPASQLEVLSAPLKGVATANSSVALPTALSEALSIRFGPLEALMFVPLKAKDIAKQKAGRDCEATALATFRSLDAAYAAVSAGKDMRMGDGLLMDIWAAWACAPKRQGVPVTDALGDVGLPGEPVRVSWMRRKGLLAGAQSGPSTAKESYSKTPLYDMPQNQPLGTTIQPVPPTFSFAPPTSQSGSGTEAAKAAGDYESATLMRLRDAERRKLEEKIRRQEVLDT